MNDFLSGNADAMQSTWDEVAKGYSAFIDGSEREAAEAIAKLLLKQGIAPGSRLIELGCGSGHLSACLNMAGYQTDLFDFSPEALNKARKTFDEHGLHGKFIQGDIMEIGQQWQNGEYDLAWNSGVMEHFSDASLIDTFRSIGKIAKRALFIVPNPQSISYLLMRYIRQAQGDWPYGKEYLRSDYIEALNIAGYDEVAVSCIGKTWTAHNFRVAVGDAAYAADAYSDMLERGILPEHEKYLTTYFAVQSPAGGAQSGINVGEGRSLSGKLTVRPAALTGSAELKTEISDLNAQRFGVEMRLREANRQLEENAGRINWYIAELDKKEAGRIQAEAAHEQAVSHMEAELEGLELRHQQEKSLLEYEYASVAALHQQEISQLQSELITLNDSLDSGKRSSEREMQSLVSAERKIAKALEVTDKLFETSLFKLLHLLHRTGKQLIKGNWKEKRRYFNWLSAHMRRQHYSDRGYNPIQEITDTLRGDFQGGSELKVLYIYKWATMGGVERVFLNRARAFKKYGLNVKTDVYFFHDSGGLENFQKYAAHHELGGSLRVVSWIDESAYDFIFTFDTPEAFDIINDTSKIIVECHTPYTQIREYLATLPNNIYKILSPSEAFLKTVLLQETAERFHGRLFTLPNFCLDEKRGGEITGYPQWNWSKKPICYIGRMDKLKNTKELLEIFAKLNQEHRGEYTLILAGDITEGYMNLKELTGKLEIDDAVEYLGSVPFEEVGRLLEQVRRQNGIFVSPSKGESFGLSVLEAMASGVPVLLTDIDCHKALAEDDADFLYKQGGIDEAVLKIGSMYGKHGAMGEKALQYSKKYTEKEFIERWKLLVTGAQSGAAKSAMTSAMH